MHLHVSNQSGVKSYLFLDDSERVAILPTNYIKDLASSPKKYSFGTLDLYSRRMESLCDFLEQHHVFGQVSVDQAISKINLTLLDEYYLSLNNRGLGASTVRGHEVVVKGFTDWLTTVQAGHIHNSSIYRNVKYRTTAPTKSMPKFVVAEEVVKLCEGMHWEIQRLVTHVMFDTGMRVSEVARLLKSEVPLLENYSTSTEFFPLFIRGSKGRGRNYKERYTIISRPVLIRLNRYFRSKVYVRCDKWLERKKPAFLNVWGEKLTSTAIQKFIGDALVRAGLEKKISPHKLRHGFSFSVLKSGNFTEALILLQKMLGHANLETTEGYTNIPGPVLRLLSASNSDQSITRVNEAEMIFERTYLSEKNLPKNRTKIGVRK